MLMLLSIVLSQLNLSYSLTTPTGVYIHIPFCRRRCFYCDFPIVVVGDRQTTQNHAAEQYTDILIKEIQSTVENYRNTISPVTSVFFGGGTPGLLPNRYLEKILETINHLIGIDNKAEISIEMDPGTFDLMRLYELHRLGINRISMGVQSFNDEILIKCGRPHNLQDIHRAIHALHMSPIDNFNIDIISSLPYLSLDTWQETIHQAIVSGCSHLSVYDLQIEEHTAFGRWYSPGIFPMPSEDASVDMYKQSVHLLTRSGYEHYEVSNFALPGRRCVHNQKYWNSEEFWGFGLGATSFVTGKRLKRPNTQPEYEKYVQSLGENPVISSSLLELDPPSDGGVDHMDIIMLSLRTTDGLDLDKISKDTQNEIRIKIIESLLPYARQNVVEFYHKRSRIYVSDDLSLNMVDTIRLHDPDGFIISNDIISAAFAILM